MFDEEILLIINYFEEEVSEADAYLVIKSNQLQKKWITSRMSYFVSKTRKYFNSWKHVVVTLVEEAANAEKVAPESQDAA